MKWLFAALAVLGTVLVVALAALGWLVGTESGLHWAAAQAGQQLAFDNLRGRLAGEMTADRLVYAADDLRIQADQVSLRAHLAALLGGRLTIEPLRIASLQIDLLPSETQAAPKAPELPLRLHLGDARVDEVIVRRGEARYVVREVVIAQAIIGEKVALSASLYYPDERFPARGTLELAGTLERIEAKASATVAGVPALAHAVITPFLPQKLESVEGQAGPVDLARLDASLPHTALSASLKAAPTAGGAFAGTLSATNAAAGALDAGRVPVVRLETRFLTDFTSMRLSQARAALHGGGMMSGDAELQPSSVNAKLVASAVDLRAMHTRLRKTALSGPLQLRIDGERQWARGSLTQEGIGLTAEIVRIGDELQVRELRALAEGGEVSGTGKVRLDGTMAFDARLQVQRFDPAKIGDYPAGSLSGAVIAAGRLNPRQIDLKWDLQDSTLYEHTFRSAGSARITGERVTQADADLRLGANRLTARGAYGRAGDSLALHARRASPGGIRADRREPARPGNAHRQDRQSTRGILGAGGNIAAAWRPRAPTRHRQGGGHARRSRGRHHRARPRVVAGGRGTATRRLDGLARLDRRDPGAAQLGRASARAHRRARTAAYRPRSRRARPAGGEAG